MDRQLKKELSKSGLGTGLILVGACCGILVVWLFGLAGGGGIVAIIAGFLVKNLFFISIGIIMLSLAIYLLFNRKG